MFRATTTDRKIKKPTCSRWVARTLAQCGGAGQRSSAVGLQSEKSVDLVVIFFSPLHGLQLCAYVQLVRCQQPNHAVGGEPDAKGDLADRGQPSIDQEGAEDLARLQRDAVGNATGEGFAGQVDQLLVGCLLERARQLCKPRDSTIPRHFSGEQESVPLPRQPLLEIHEGSFPYICNQTLESNFHYSILL